jgi:hypothetical protein
VRPDTSSGPSTSPLGVMASRTTALSFRAALVVIAAASVLAAEPVTVYLKPPSEIAEQRNLEAVLRDLPAHKSQWAAFAKATLTYVVRQASEGMLPPDPCEGLPIRVKISRGLLQSAYYESSGGHCRKGQPAGHTSPTGGRLYLTPDDFFQRIAEAEQQLRCYKQPERGCLPTSLRVAYDQKLGLPTKLEDYSVLVSDYYWSLEVTEIHLAP